MTFTRPVRFSTGACVIIIAILLLYSWKIEPGNLTVTNIEMAVPSLVKSCTVVFMADLHLPLNARIEQKLFVALGKIRPDLILIGGDFSSYHTPAAYAIDKLNLLSRFGKTVMVMGNTDICRSRQCVYCYLKYPVDRLGSLPAVILRNQVLDLPAFGIRLVGLDDPVTMLDDTLLLQPARQPCCNVLLLHSVYKLTDDQKNRFDLICSGHTHGGQVFFSRPFLHWMDPAIDPRYVGGIFHINKTVLAVTRGIGQSFLPLRLGVPPEIMVFHLSKSAPPHSPAGGFY